MRMQFNLLGPLEVVDCGTTITLGGIKQRATLGFLLLHANKVVPTSRLVKALWDGDPPATARKVLQNAVAGVRALLPSDGAGPHPAALLTRAPGYVLEVEDFCVDLTRFRGLADKGRADLARGS